MNLITCSADCKYQQDGYCGLDVPGAVTNVTHPGCVHYLPRNGETASENGQFSGTTDFLEKDFR